MNELAKPKQLRSTRSYNTLTFKPSPVKTRKPNLARQMNAALDRKLSNPKRLSFKEAELVTPPRGRMVYHKKKISSERSSTIISGNPDLSSKSIHHGTPMNISSIPISQHDDDSFLDGLQKDNFFQAKTDLMSDLCRAMSPKFGEEHKEGTGVRVVERTVVDYEATQIVEEIPPEMQAFIDKLKREKMRL